MSTSGSERGAREDPRAYRQARKVSRILWFLRHAEAADGIPDEQRVLTARGVRHAEAAGLALARLGVSIDVCLTSPKTRALQTARLACEPLGIEPTVEPRLGGEPFDPSDLTVGLGDALLVGHDPSFSLVVHDLTGAQARLRKGGLAGVAKGELVLLVRPSELMAIAYAEERVS